VDDNFSSEGNTLSLEDVQKRYDIGTPYILSVGARRPHKNFNRLIQAFSRIRSEYPHDLILVGASDPRFPDEVRLELERENLDGRVKCLDWVSEKDLPVIYTLADFVVLPSILEGFGLPALESMASGTPVICE
jgi:glycosyltransferase involved in cell wall biosynthesis